VEDVVVLEFFWQLKFVCDWTDDLCDFEWSVFLEVQFLAWPFCSDVSCKEADFIPLLKGQLLTMILVVIVGGPLS